MKVPAQIKYLILTLLFIAGSINMISTTRKVIKSSKRLDEAKKEVLSLETAKEELLQEIEYKKTEDYVEKVARNKLNLIKPGEEIYIYPESEEKTPKRKVYSTEKGNLHPKRPIYAWIELFF